MPDNQWPPSEHQAVPSLSTGAISKQYDVAIIGSGHNGLVTAAYLARAGKRVLVIEAQDRLGGATTSQKIFPDYDAMISRYAYLVSLFPQQIIDDLGLNFSTRRRQVASFTPWHDGQRERGLLLWNDNPVASRQSIEMLPGGTANWEGYQHLLALQTALAKLVWPTMTQPLRHRHDFESCLVSDIEKEAWHAFVERPLGEVLERTIPSDLLRGVLMTDGKIGVFTHPHDESLLQNRCFLYHVIGGGTGEWRVPVGGMQAVVRSLLQACRQYGVDFVFPAPATQIALGHPHHEVHFNLANRAVSVAATHVMVNASPRVLSSLLGTPWEPSTADEGSVVKVNMLLRRLPKLKARDIPAEHAFCGSLHLEESYSAMLQSYQTASQGNLPLPPPSDVYCHTLTDRSILSPELAAAGYHTLTLFGLDVPYRLFETNAAERKAALTRYYLESLDRMCDESFDDCLAVDSAGQPCIEIKTPQDLEAEVGLDRGNIFHNELSWFFTDDRDAVGRWGVETPYERIYRAGSSAMRGGAVSGIPGYNAAKCLLG